MTGNITTAAADPSAYELTDRGRNFVELSTVIARVFGVDPRFLHPSDLELEEAADVAPLSTGLSNALPSVGGTESQLFQENERPIHKQENHL
ncbi:MAG: hypothetical protein IJ228_03395 [Succinivibrio sp.]|nr:hypothetical protein [Succinivibrio sp.]